MRGGRIQQIGTPEEVYTRPVNRFVGEFIGTPTMNVLAGELRAAGAGVRFESAALALALSDGWARPAPARGVLLGFRPEHITLVAPGTAGAATAEVSVSELAGAERFIFLKLGGETIIARLPASVRVEAGERVGVQVDPDTLHLFDQETEMAI
jgi:sn-glycerol 3-phosphate transport system ATP-binding protein